MTDKEVMKKLLGLLINYKKTICIIILCLLISTGISLYMPIVSSKIMDDGFIGGDKETLVRLVLVVLGAFILSSLLSVIKEKKRIDISTKIKLLLEENVFTHLMKIKIAYFRNKNYAEILSNLNMDICNISAIADDNVFFVITQLFSMIGGIIGLFILDYRLTVLVLLFLPVKYIVVKYFAKMRKSYMDSYIINAQEYSGWFGDVISGVREVKLFGIFENKLNEFQAKKGIVIEHEKKMSMLGQWNNIVDSLLVQVMMAFIYIVGANLVFAMELTVGNVFAFITYSTYVTSPISVILSIGYHFSGIIPSTKRYYQFMDYEEEYSVDINQRDSMFLKEYLNGCIEFKNVSFSYDGNKNIITDLSFLIPQNAKIAIMGDNGSGKSTILYLLFRFYEPAEGNILIGGKNIQQIPIEMYRSMISVVSQDIYLFNDTIRNNIALYKSIDDNAIEEACKQSGLEEFISKASLNYCVGHNGMMLSGGQKQKIALARALVHDKPIVIFDEATSNADNYSVKLINNLLHTNLRNKTVIIVSHKKEIENEVDCVLRLENGHITSSLNIGGR